MNKGTTKVGRRGEARERRPIPCLTCYFSPASPFSSSCQCLQVSGDPHSSRPSLLLTLLSSLLFFHFSTTQLHLHRSHLINSSLSPYLTLSLTYIFFSLYFLSSPLPLLLPSFSPLPSQMTKPRLLGVASPKYPAQYMVIMKDSDATRRMHLSFLPLLSPLSVPLVLFFIFMFLFSFLLSFYSLMHVWQEMSL